ncbi:MAG TPA: hypothetical protein VGD67_07860 [Pseudonocardiaceae bacterium]
MARPDRSEEDPPGPSGRFADDLIGLDPDDPDAQAFAAHLDRMERAAPAFTVEGSLAGVRDFAESANRAHGSRRVFAMAVVGLLLLGVVVVVWDAIVFMLGILL